MRVLITGGTGLIGKTTCEHLLMKGWQVRSLDLVLLKEPDDIEHVQGDILHFEALLKAMENCDAVVHLAALRSPTMAQASSIFHVNAAGTFNVFEAAAKSGIRRVVQASSINAYGFYYGTVEHAPRYLPVDEDHPTLTTDPYSFSKQIDESIGAYFWRRDGISSAALRFPAVLSPGYGDREDVRARRSEARQAIDDLAALPIGKRRTQMARLRRLDREWRAGRPFDYRPNDSPLSAFAESAEPLSRIFEFDRPNFWAALDVRDAAQSIEKCLTAGYDGAHPLFINDRRNYLGYDGRALARLFFPNVRRFTADLAGPAALVSIERARALIGFEPEYSVMSGG